MRFFFILDNSYVLKILCVFIRKTVTRQRNVRTWAEFEFLDFFMLAATMTHPFSILPFFPISFSFPNSIYNLLENNIYKFWFVIVVFFGSRRARARRSSDAFSFLIGRKRSKICCHVSWCQLGIAWWSFTFSCRIHNPYTIVQNTTMRMKKNLKVKKDFWFLPSFWKKLDTITKWWLYKFYDWKISVCVLKNAAKPTKNEVKWKSLF